MEYLTVITAVTQHLGEEGLNPQDPIVRAALDLVVRPWLDGIHSGAEAMQWGEFATTVQDAAAGLWSGPAAVAIPADTAIASAPLNAAARALATHAAHLFTRAAAPDEVLAWQYAACAAQLLDAATHLP